MPKPKVLSRGLRSRARAVARSAALVSVVTLVVWPGAVGASDLSTGVLPPAPERLRDTIDRAVGDAGATLERTVKSGRNVVDDLTGAVQEALAEGGGATRPDPVAAETSAPRRRDQREVQAGDEQGKGRGDVDDLVATGDEIGATGVQDRQVSPPARAAAESLPFTGFDPARLLLSGVTMILCGLALLTSARSGYARRELAA